MADRVVLWVCVIALALAVPISLAWLSDEFARVRRMREINRGHHARAAPCGTAPVRRIAMLKWGEILHSVRGRPWVWGERPPAWALAGLAEALELMGRRGERVHALEFSAGPAPESFSIVIGVCRRRDLEHFLSIVADALVGKVITPNMREDWPSRKAVQGDI